MPKREAREPAADNVLKKGRGNDKRKPRTRKPNVVFVDDNNAIVTEGDDPANVPVGSGLWDPRKPDEFSV